MRLTTRNTQRLILTPTRSTVSMRPIMGRGAKGEQGLPGPGSAAWAGAQAVTVGSVRQAPDGSLIKSTHDRTTRATFDDPEKGFWTAVSVTEGTLERTQLDAHLSASIDASVQSGGVARPTLDAAFRPTGRKFPIFEGLKWRLETSHDFVDEDNRLWFFEGSWGADYLDCYPNDAGVDRLPAVDPRLGVTGRTGFKFSDDPDDPDGFIYRGRVLGTGAGPADFGDSQSFSIVIDAEWTSSLASQLGSLIGNHPETGPHAGRQWLAAVNQQSFDGAQRVVFHISASGVGTPIDSDPDNDTNYEFGASARAIKGRRCLIVVTYDHETGVLTTYIDGTPENDRINPDAYPFPRGNPMPLPNGINRDPGKGKFTLGFSPAGVATTPPFEAQNGWLGGSSWVIDGYECALTDRQIGLLALRYAENLGQPFSLDDFMTDFQVGGGTNYSLYADMGAENRDWDSFGTLFNRNLSDRITAPAARISRPGGNGIALSESAFMIQVSDGQPALTRRRIPVGSLPSKALVRATVDDLSESAAGARHFYFAVTNGAETVRVIVEDTIEAIVNHTSGADWTVADLHEYFLKLVGGATGWDAPKLRVINFDDSGTGTDHALTFRNHMKNPRAGASASSWNAWTATGSVVTQARTVGADLGVSDAHMAYTFPTTTNAGNRNVSGFRYECLDPFQPGDVCTFGPGALYLPRDNRLFVGVQWKTAGGVITGIPRQNGTSVPLEGGEVLTLSENGPVLPYVISECPAAAGANAIAEVFVAASSSGVDWQAGDVVKVIGGMGVDKPVMPFTYFDGVYGGGAWVGSANNSASTRTDHIDGGESITLGDLITERMAGGWLTEYGIYYEPGPVGSTSRWKNFALWTNEKAS